MKEIIASPNRVLHLGYEGEDNVTLIKFPYDDTWLDCGDGEFKIRVLRHGDTQAYNATESTDDRESMILTMVVTDIELSVRGRGELQLVYVCSGAIKKSEIYQYNVHRAIDSEVVSPPDGSIIASVEESLAEIKDEIGSLSDLTTTDKSSLVSAINEVNAKEVKVVTDSEMSDTSTNPVQNKAIKAYVDDAVSHVTIDVDSELSATSENPVQNKVVKARFDSVDQTVAGIGGRLATAETDLSGKADKSYVDTELASKANSTDVNTALSAKANSSDVNSALALKANTADVNTALSAKANTADMNTALALKANSADVQTALAGKASTDVATTSANGLMSSADKTKLDGLGNSGVSDVQINGTSVVSDGVANIPIADSSTAGVVKADAEWGIGMYDSAWSGGAYGNFLYISPASSAQIKSGSTNYKALVPNAQHESVFYGLAKVAGHDEKNSTLPVGQYTEEAKSAIHDMLNGAVQVSGTTPTITALSGVRYVCGEVATLDITPCVSGICDVIFTSGSTATVLTLPSTVKFPDGAFTPEANTTYELNIMDGVYGAVMAWT